MAYLKIKQMYYRANIDYIFQREHRILYHHSPEFPYSSLLPFTNNLFARFLSGLYPSAPPLCRGIKQVIWGIETALYQPLYKKLSKQGACPLVRSKSVQSIYIYTFMLYFNSSVPRQSLKLIHSSCGFSGSFHLLLSPVFGMNEVGDTKTENEKIQQH